MAVRNGGFLWRSRGRCRDGPTAETSGPGTLPSRCRPNRIGSGNSMTPTPTCAGMRPKSTPSAGHADRAEWQTASGEDRGREIVRRTRAVKGLEAGPSHEHGERTGDQARPSGSATGALRSGRSRTTGSSASATGGVRRTVPGISGMVIELQKKRRGAVE